MLEGLGQLEIAPGGSDLSQLRAEAKQLADRQEALLQRLGLSSLEAAEDRHQTHRLKSRKERLEQILLVPRDDASAETDKSCGAVLHQKLAAEGHKGNHKPHPLAATFPYNGQKSRTELPL